MTSGDIDATVKLKLFRWIESRGNIYGFFYYVAMKLISIVVIR